METRELSSLEEILEQFETIQLLYPNMAIERYKQYSWAKPIIMKYQDATFENAFWRQLAEIYDEWKDLKMVGTISSKAIDKINIDDIDYVIMSKTYFGKGYYHFADGSTPVLESYLTQTHPNFAIIWNDLLKMLGLKDTTESLFNYWMCSPKQMLRYTEWFKNSCYPAIISHPLSFTDAKYNDPGSLNSEQLMSICGQPHYPHIPFILERLNKCYFMTYEQPRIVIYSVNLGNYDTVPIIHEAQSQPYERVHYTSDEDRITLDSKTLYEGSKKWRLAAHLLNKVKGADIAIYLDSNVKISDPYFIENIVNDGFLVSPKGIKTKVFFQWS
jgi:hypothetical protein